ncbi:MAG: polysaccharide biosynthesis protein, partial [Actinomycetes bacterium]
MGAWTAALTLRYDGRVPAETWLALGGFLPVAVGVTITIQIAAGLYSGVWQQASVLEARRVILAQLAAMACLTPTVLVMHRPVPLSVPVIAGVLITGAAGLLRFQSRLFLQRRHRAAGSSPCIVIGAGEAGAALVRDIRRRDTNLEPVAFIDDDPRLRGRQLMGLTVRGGVEDLATVSSSRGVTQAVLAIPSAEPHVVRRVAAACEQAQLALRVLPPIGELADGSVTLGDVRDLEINDLLGRDQVGTDLTIVGALIEGRRVLVTGGGGSIGSEIARQVAALRPSQLVLLDNDETHLFEAAATLPPSVALRLADVRDEHVMRRILLCERPHLVFHAAAHKHVPLLEDHPSEAAKTNIMGTRNVLEAAHAAGVERFIFISTDKAVEPKSVMGASKRVGEHLVLGRSGQMVTCAVRFGNVLGSRGSVVPTFVRQIRTGGPVTVTDGRMTRYFMSIPEAVRLVIHSGALASGGEIFMLDMGQPVQIVDLAKRMIRLSGCRPGLDIEIRVTGVRPGEKLAEQLSMST